MNIATKSLGKTAAVLGAFMESTRRLPCGASADQRFSLVLAAAAPAVFAGFAVTEAGKLFFRELRRWQRIHEKRPAGPSLRGTPQPGELAGDWSQSPRTLSACLRLGSRLADLEPTLDSSLVYKTLPNGRKAIAARKGGVKGWLRDHRVPVGYGTVMGYKKLVQRLRQVLALDERLPLEWLLPGAPADRPLPVALSVPFETARRRLARMLRENPSLAALTRLAEKKLGIRRLIAVRKAHPRRRKTGAKRKEKQGFTVILRNHSVSLADARMEATKEALRHLLAARHLAGRALDLQNRAKKWLAGLPPPAATP